MPELRTISGDALREALQAHVLWLKFPSRGRKGDLSFCNLPGVDLSRIDLRRISLSGANLSSARLAGANFSDADFFGANLDGANLRETQLNRANLRGVRLRAADLEGAVLQDADLREGILFRHQGAVRTGRMEMVALTQVDSTNFMRADLSNAKLSRAVFRNAHLNGAILLNAEMHDADFAGADLSDTDLRGADLGHTNFTGARLRGARLAGVVIDRTTFSNADLTGLDPEDSRTLRPWAPDARFDADGPALERISPAELERRTGGKGSARSSTASISRARIFSDAG